MSKWDKTTAQAVWNSSIPRGEGLAQPLSVVIGSDVQIFLAGRNVQGDRIVDHFLAVHSGLDGKSRDMINFGPGQGILRRDAQEELSACQMLALLGTDGVAMTYPISTPAGREVRTDVMFPTPVSIVLGLGIELRLRGASGILYALERSSDLVRWESLDRIRADGWGGGSWGGS